MIKTLLYLLLFLLPTQLGKHWWFEWSYKLGMRVDYLSPTIYVTDVLVLVILAVYFTPGVVKFLSTRGWKTGRHTGRPLRLICGFVGLLMVVWWLFRPGADQPLAGAVRENPWLLAYNLLKLTEMAGLAYVIAKTFKPRDWPQIIKVLNWALILQVALAAYQVLASRSYGLWILGERLFTIGTPGIAKFLAPGGSLFLRGYGTFPHPNLLGGFSLLMLAANGILFLGLFTPEVEASGNKNDPGGIGLSKSFRKSLFFTPRGWCDWDFGFFYLIGFLVSLLGIWLSMSVGAIIMSQVILIFVGVYYGLLLHQTKTQNSKLKAQSCKTKLENIIKKNYYLIILFIIPLFIVFLPVTCQLSHVNCFKNDSLSRRLILLQTSWQMFKSSPVFGVGLGNFIPSMPAKPIGEIYFFQPVHNVPVLIGVELGLVGLIIVGWLIWKLIKRFMIYDLRFKKINVLFINHKSYIIILISWWLIILMTGLFDHYWLTLQQGRLMLAVVIGLTLVELSKD